MVGAVTLASALAAQVASTAPATTARINGVFRVPAFLLWFCTMSPRFTLVEIGIGSNPRGEI
jgi:hypothetical protein